MAKPVLRLKGFEGEWKAISFHESFSFLKNYSLSRDELSEEGKVKNVHYGDVLIKFGELLDVSKEQLPFVKDNDLGIALAKERSLENGDIIFADAAEDNTVGKCVEILGLTCNDKMISGLHTIPCRPSKEFEKGYLGYYLNSCKFHDQLLPHIQGTKVSSISKKAIESTTVFCPQDCKEQKAITDYFKSLDSMIQKTTKKIASLKQMKSASLISMFPQAGETTPRVRFKGFEDGWKAVKIMECLEEVNVRNYPIQTDFVLSLTIKDGVLPYSEKGHIGNRAKEDHTLYKLAYPDTIVLNSMNILIGAIGMCDYFGCVSPVYYVFKCTEIANRRFLFDIMSNRQFQRELRQIASGMMEIRQKVPINELMEKKVLIPSLDEQQRIADYFRSLDKLISLQEQRLEKLKQIKSACLDKMFV